MGVIQLGYVVEDLDRALDYWSRVVGAGPFFVSTVSLDMSYRGAVSRVDWTSALAYAGPMMVELIRQDNDAPSLYSDHFREHGNRLHHFMIDTDDYDGALARYAEAGSLPVFSHASEQVGRFCYLDAVATLGCFVEIFEPKPGTPDFFALIARAHQNWDGTTPIRPYADLY